MKLKQKHSSSTLSTLKKWIVSHRVISLIITSIVILFIGGVTFALTAQPSDVKSAKNPNQVQSNLPHTRLNVESDPNGLTMQSEQDCDSEKLQQITPYTCAKVGAFTAVVNAPGSVSVNGTTYHFKTWDGCSESNEDKKICKVVISEKETKIIKAVYEIKTGQQSVTTSKTIGKNDTVCKTSSAPTQTLGFGKGPGSAYSSSTGKDMICTMKFEDIPAGGILQSEQVVYASKKFTSCADLCSKYDAYNMGTYWNQYRIAGLRTCSFNGMAGDCGSAVSSGNENLRSFTKPVELTFRGFEVYDEYYGASGDGCYYYYCLSRSTFDRWSVVYEPSTSSGLTKIKIIAYYTQEVFYDPTQELVTDWQKQQKTYFQKGFDDY